MHGLREKLLASVLQRIMLILLDNQQQDGPAPKKKGEGPHMESWMPQLPPAYTYVSTVEQRNALKDGVSEQTVSKQRRQVWDARAFTCRILLFLRDILNPVARIFRFRPKKSLWS